MEYVKILYNMIILIIKVIILSKIITKVVTIIKTKIKKKNNENIEGFDNYDYDYNNNYSYNFYPMTWNFNLLRSPPWFQYERMWRHNKLYNNNIFGNNMSHNMSHNNIYYYYTM